MKRLITFGDWTKKYPKNIVRAAEITTNQRKRQKEKLNKLGELNAN